MNRCFIGDCRDTMRELIAQGVRVQTCVTSPPYFGLRDYGHPGQIGLEATPAEYVERMVDVFRLVRELLADDGTLWLNLGDSYGRGERTKWAGDAQRDHTGVHSGVVAAGCYGTGAILPNKQLIGIPWRVAFALQADGWYLRSDIIWHKPNPMPESVTDRPTKAHEYIFLLTKSERYYYDAEAIAEEASYGSHGGTEPNPGIKATTTGNHSGTLGLTPKQRASVKRGEFNGKTNALEGREAFRAITEKRNKRTVWTVTTKPYTGAHFATFPPDLIEPCILAGSRPGDIVLDPFFGSGTTGEVSQRLGRQWIGCELNPAYVPLQEKRTAQMGMCI